MAKSTIGGKFAGVSLLVDRRRMVFVEWDWHQMKRYASPADFTTLQETVWRQLLPCAIPAWSNAH